SRAVTASVGAVVPSGAIRTPPVASGLPATMFAELLTVRSPSWSQSPHGGAGGDRGFRGSTGRGPRRGPSRRRCARPRAQARPRAPQGAGCGDGGASQGDSLGLELSSELVAVRAALGVGEVLEAADLADRADVPLRRVGL